MDDYLRVVRDGDIESVGEVYGLAYFYREYDGGLEDGADGCDAGDG